MTQPTSDIKCFLVEARSRGEFIHDKQRYRYDDLPVGAMWFLDGYVRKGPDGRTLWVRVPGDFDWSPDKRCSNCTKPDDHTHRCWVRHGIAPNITVDKNGDTCTVGVGSLIAPHWHGFLINGYLTTR